MNVETREAPPGGITEAFRRAADAMDRFAYALGGRDVWGEWETKMDPDEFDRRGDARREEAYRGGLSAGAFVMAVTAAALWAFIVTAVVWGAMT